MSLPDPASLPSAPAPAAPIASSSTASSLPVASPAASSSSQVIGGGGLARPIPSAVRLRQPFPVRNSSVTQVHEACLEYIHIEMVASFYESPNSDSAAAALKLERVGFRVGQKITEKLSMSRPRFASDIDRIKFVCKEFWNAVFRRPQVDNLKTNNRGTYVLTDTKFRWLANLSGTDAATLAPRYTHFPCGLIRGCLAALGVHCSVTAETQNLPVCTFRLELKDPKE